MVIRSEIERHVEVLRGHVTGKPTPADDVREATVAVCREFRARLDGLPPDPGAWAMVEDLGWAPESAGAGIIDAVRRGEDVRARWLADRLLRLRTEDDVAADVAETLEGALTEDELRRIGWVS